MEVLILGAGREIGRSCIIVSIEDKTIMLDCGLHVGYSDERRFPDFDCLSRSKNFDKIIDCVLISHFHLDHTGALPYFTEVLGYTGPIYMTHPTKAILPLLLDDCQKLINMRDKKQKNYTIENIENCMKKITAIDMNETILISDKIVITPYYAGHVIGAAMFHVRVGKSSFVYTGDFSTAANQHLSGAWIEELRPDLMITESTYANLVRDCRKSRERDFLQSIHTCVNRGGVVLIPIPALGRAQEICLILEDYWNRLGLTIPIYFTGNMAEKANEIYKRFIGYTNETVRRLIHERNVFEFSHIKPYYKGCEYNGPCVIFSSPGMLHMANSFKIFSNICSGKNNLVILPGYCIRGTLGDKILNGSKFERFQGLELNIELEVKNISFSAHADMLGIMKIIKQCKPKSVMLVHGEKSKMQNLKKSIIKECKIPVYMPSNGIVVRIPNTSPIELSIDRSMLMKAVDIKKDCQNISLVATIENRNDEIIATDIKEFFVKKK